jgi:hypothetical protein
LFAERKRPRFEELTSVNTTVDGIQGRIHLQFDEVDIVMAQSGLDLITTDFKNVRVMTMPSGDQPICVELQLAKVFPFPMDQVAECMWRCLRSDRVDLRNGFFGGSPMSDNMSKVHFSVNLRICRKESTLNVHGIAARELDTRRSKIVFESVGAKTGDVFTQSPIACREQGYTVIESHPSGDGSTIVKVCGRIWPQITDGLEGSEESHVGRFTDLTVASYNENTEVWVQIVENALLEQRWTSDAT